MKFKLAFLITAALLIAALGAMAQNALTPPSPQPSVEDRISRLEMQVSTLQVQVLKLESDAKPSARRLNGLLP